MDCTVNTLLGPNLPAPINVPTRPKSVVANAALLASQLAQMAALADLVSRIESSADRRAACQTLVDRLQDHLSANTAYVGLCREGSPSCRLTAISHVAAFHARDERALAAQAVLQEAVARGEAVIWPATSDSERGGLLSHRQFAASEAVAVIISGPLRDASGRLCGAWLATFGEAGGGKDEALGFFRAAEQPVAAALHLVGRAEAGVETQIFRAVARMAKERRGRTRLFVAALVFGILCIPLPYRPRCDCTVEPVTRRYVAAPFDGPLESSFVEPGDEVAAGDLLARMDGREIHWELAGTRAEWHRATKERAGHLALHESGQAEVARYEVDRLKLRTELLEHRDQNLEIRSPISGVVVSGDWKDSEGMPLEVGQALFEIAPLDAMIVEIAVAEDDFAYVRPGMPVAVNLDAYPLRALDATIMRIHPRAELRDDENVFVAEVQLANADGSLRPGMRGTARVESERRPLGWILLRRPVGALIAWLGW